MKVFQMPRHRFSLGLLFEESRSHRPLEMSRSNRMKLQKSQNPRNKREAQAWASLLFLGFWDFCSFIRFDLDISNGRCDRLSSNRSPRLKRCLGIWKTFILLSSNMIWLVE